MIEILTDALADSIKMLPFLFAAYWLIEFVEHRHSRGIEKLLAGGGKAGFLYGAVLGCFPQCGFSAMAANLYGGKMITLGTLIAVFLATSDEAIPVMIASPRHWKSLAVLIAAKVIVAVIAGFCIDFFLRRLIPRSLRGGYTGNIDRVDCHEHNRQESILAAAVRHTVHIFAFILVFNIVIGAAVELTGLERLTAFLYRRGVFQPLIAGIVGLIPNCAASILLTQLYMDGVISFGSVLAGLCTGAGVGLAVIFRSNKNLRQNLFVLLLLYITGCGAGMAVQLAGIVI